VKDVLLRLKGVLIAIVVLALSASLAFGAQAPAGGWSAAGTFEKNENAGGDEEATETEEEESAEDAGDNCLVDPTTATPEVLDTLNHGQVVCWAAHQTEWPGWFTNKGKFVSCWAHSGKEGAPSCTEAPAEDATTTHGKAANDAAATHSKGKGTANHPTK
jgi:hypothetical protein